ncbi:hypothetical protein ACA910_006954 [Epithemia clementina (nom. ined.)]
MTLQRNKRQDQRNQKLKRTFVFLGILLLVGLLLNVLLLHGRLDENEVSKSGTNKHSPLAVAAASAVVGKESDEQTTRQHRQQLSLHYLRRRVQHYEVREADLLLLWRLHEALDRQKLSCHSKPLRRTPPQRFEMNQKADSFGLLSAMKHLNLTPLKEFNVSHTRAATTAHLSRDFCRIVLIVTSSGYNLRQLFVNHLKWLYLEHHYGTTTATVKFPKIVIEKIWLLLPVDAMARLEIDKDYGRRLLAWDQQRSHPVSVLFGKSFWDALSQVDDSTASDFLPVLFLDGDRESLSGTPLWDWLDTRLILWYKDPSSAIMPIAVVTDKDNTTTMQQASQMAKDKPFTFCGISGREPITGRPLPSLHLSVHQASRVFFLQHPVMVHVQNLTVGNDWKVSELAAAILLSWNGYHIVKDQEGKPQQHVTVQLNQTETNALSQALAYIGGIPPPAA